MTDTRHAQQAAALLREHARESAPPSAEDRAFLIAHLEEALARKVRRRRALRGLGVLASLGAVAAAIVLYKPARERNSNATTREQALVAVARPTGDGAELVGVNGAHPLLDGQALPAGSRLVTDKSGGAALGLATGTSLSLEHDANLEVVSTGESQRFQLVYGAVSAKVAKLASGQRFVVGTPDSEVEVHGTAFRIRVGELDTSCQVASRTHVDVTEGIVEVRSADRSWLVHPGESWPAGCVSPSAPPPAKPAASGRDALRPKPSSSLNEQNDLFSQGIAALHAQNTAAALAAFDTLIRKFPGSPLSEDATVKRMQVLRATSPEAAAGAARDYLQRYPHGYARAEAEAMLGGSP